MAPGILAPAMAYRFRACFDTGSKDANADFMSNMHSVDINYAEKTATIMLRESCTGSTSRAVMAALNVRGKTFMIEYLQDHEADWQIDLYDTEIKEHSLKFDYSDGGIAYHRLVISWKSAHVSEPGAEQAIP